MRSTDLMREAMAGILQRSGRTALTVVGILLGVAAFVAVLGLTATATGQISRHFTELAATEVTVEDVAAAKQDADGTAFPENADDRVLAINGVRHAGVFWPIPQQRVGSVTGVPLPGVSNKDVIPVVATSPGLFAAVRARLSAGRNFDSALDGRRERVALVGAAVARALGVTRIDGQSVVFLGGVPFSVAGVVDSVQRHQELLATVWVPRQTAEALWPGAPSPSQPPVMVIDTSLGAAGVVARQAPLALRPDAVSSFRATAPADPRQLRDQVNTDLSGLFLGLAAICLLIGAVGIANTTLVAVLERVPEIGLRRSLGAQRHHIAAQFLSESATLGGVGGLIGAGVGVAVVVAVSAARQWTPILEPWTVLAAPVVGAVTGLLAGLYPALRASRIEPAEALRQQ
jgi:putative ABC transport system permease protein